MRRLLPLLSLSVGLTACDPTDPNADPPVAIDDASLLRFDNCGELQGYVADAWLEQVVQSRYGGGYFNALAEDASAPAADRGAEDGPSDFSETNTQEAGVDEPDIVKTDGTHVYVVQSGRHPQLTIVKSWPVADSAVVGQVAIEGYPTSMFLHGGRAVVFSQIYSSYDERGQRASPYRDGYATRITLVDVTDRGAPEIERTIDLDGWMTTARMIEDDLYLVSQAYAYVPQEIWELGWSDDIELPEFDWEATEEEQEAVRHEARRILRPHVDRIVRETSVETLLPQQYAPAAGGDLVASPLLGCSDVYRPEGLSQPSVMAMSHLDLSSDEGELSATGLMANGWTVYASKDNLYVAQTSNWWWWGWGNVDMSTHIHKFSLEGDDSRYQGSGEVQGWLWQQFAMSEHDGHLRVATTDIDWWWGMNDDRESGNNVFVLDENLKQVGAVTGFAPGEQIYSARFIGDEGYVVTFRQIDPLFTFDLSDPTAPTIMGELKIPGFSSYLHPYGDGRLIGVGMDGDDDGNVRGLAINLFDVSDLTDPTRIDQIVVESDDWSWSEALWNHHAFTLHRDVLSLPIYTWDWDADEGTGEGFSGMMSVAVSNESLETVGRVGHADLVEDSECLYYWYDEREQTCPSDFWYAGMRRSVVIEDNLFSISDYGIKVTDLEDPSTVHARVLFFPR